MRGFIDAADIVCSPQIEGGYVNDPKDPGKETNLGITWPVLREAIELELVPADTTIKNLTRPTALVIYRHLFWDRYRCGDMPYPLGLAFFDTVVNHSPRWAAKKLQQALGVFIDASIGRDTIAAANQMPTIEVVRRLLKLRMELYLHGEPADVEERFELGWANRLLDVEAEAIIAALTNKENA